MGDVAGEKRRVSLVNAKWNEAGDPDPLREVAVLNNTIIPHMSGRAYFAKTCVDGKYDFREYVALNLLGKSMQYTTDISEVGCGCNVAVYLTSMAQNRRPTKCSDYYCDAH